MTVLLDRNTAVIVQGITGRIGSFHTKEMKEYGTNVVGGVTPGKGGASEQGVPVFAADGRPPASPWPAEYDAIGSIACVTFSATAGSMRCSAGLGPRSIRTFPSSSTTFCTK